MLPPSHMDILKEMLLGPMEEALLRWSGTWKIFTPAPVYYHE